MNELATREQPREVLTLEGYQQRLWMYRQQAWTGWLGVGRTLIDAKEAGVVPHGQWEAWAEEHAGVSIKVVQRLMQLAREFEGAPVELTRLGMSKAAELLSIPAPERAAFAKEVDADNKTVRELRQAVKERQEAEQRVKALERSLEAKDAVVRAANDQRNRAAAAVNAMGDRVKALERQLDDAINHPQVVEREVAPGDYEQLKARDQAAAARIREAENYADEQE